MVRYSSKLAIGTANFGFNYGIKNTSGKVSDNELNLIVEYAHSAGITTYDTAQAYGDSEVRLGKALKAKPKVITKVKVDNITKFKADAVIRSVQKSLENMNLKRLYGILLHSVDPFLDENISETLSGLEVLRERKLVEKIGVSIYQPDSLKHVFKHFKPDIIQAPFNVFDNRLYESGWACRLKKMGIEIHIRSVFLQGVLLLDYSDLPLYFRQGWPKQFKSWLNYQKQCQVSADEIALKFCLLQPWADKVIVGVDNLKQLQRLHEIENLNAKNEFCDLSIEDELLINPSKWTIE